MPNEEIIGGLKSALERGQSLQEAMMSLFNSGYKKEEIEEAARNLMQQRAEIQAQPQPPIKTPETSQIKQTPKTLPSKKETFQKPQPKSIPQQQIPSPPKKTISQKKETETQKTKPQQVSKQKPVQKISSYEQPKQKEKKPKEKIIIFTLIFLLVFLVGLLGVIFLFKQQLINFFSNFFG